MKAFDDDFLSKLERIRLNSKKAVAGATGGNRRSKAKGSSIEFSDFREYTTGDDYRSIDWNAYARFEKLFVKLYMEERETNITVLLDTSASMGKTHPEKGIAAKRLAAVFVYAALAGYDRVGIAAISSRGIEHLPYFSGKAGLARALAFLEGLEFEASTSLKSSITACTNLYGRKGVTILISDLFSGDSYKDALKWLKYQQQEVVLVQVLARDELTPRWTGPVRLIDSETGRDVQVELSPRALSLYQKALDAFLDDIQAFCTNMEISYCLIPSDLSIDEIIFGSLFKAGIIS